MMEIKLQKYISGVLSGVLVSCCGAAQPETYLAETRLELQKKWPDNRTINIVCHGHSVPSGYFKTPEVNTFNAYPHLLHKALKEKYPYAVINVIVTGIGGETSAQGAQRFEKDVLSHSPDIITIDYALNDRRLGLEKSKAAWSSMIKAAKAKGIEVLLLTPTGDRRADLNDDNDPLNLHAEQIRALAQEYDVGLVDSYAAFAGYVMQGGAMEDLLSQVNHPNRKGHDLVVEELMKWFAE